MEREKEMEKVMEKILRWQLLAEQYFNENENIFIREFNGDIHFCKIVMVGETKVTIDTYAPEQRAGKRDVARWRQHCYTFWLNESAIH